MTAQSAEGICNLALDKCGADPLINPLTAPVKPNEKLLARQYPHWRDAELRRHRWKFSIETRRLTPVGDPLAIGPNAPLSYFQIPNEAVRAIRNVETTWTLTTGRRLLDASTTFIDVDFVFARLPAEMDPLFIEVLACRLAHACTEKINQSNEKKKDLWDQYTFALAEAKRANAYEAGPEAWVDVNSNTQYTWEQARNL